MNSRKNKLFCSAVAIVSAASFSAKAQGAAEETGASSDEIVVTALRREQSLKDVPLSVSVFTSDQINDAGVASLADLSRLTSGLSFDNTGVSRPKMYIRGMGTEAFDAGSDPAVAVFIDDVYISRFQGIDIELLDLERIEVLKGPQGTLFGRNASAGAINVVSKAPEAERGAEFQATVGNLAAVTARASLNVPVVEDVLLSRFSFGYKRREGYSKNTLTGVNHNNIDRWAGRGQLLFTPTPEFKAKFSIDFLSADENMWALENINDSIGIISASAGASGLYDRSLDPFSERYSTDGYQNRDSWGTSLRADWEIGPGTLTSITGFRVFELSERQDLDGTAAYVADRSSDEEAESFSQEIRYDVAMTPWLRVLAGVYYQNEDIDRTDRIYFGGEAAFAPLDPDFSIVDDVTVDVEAISAFGQAEIDLTSTLKLSLGARYGEDTKTLNRQDYYDDCAFAACAAPFLAAPYTVTVKRTWSSFDPTVVLSYQPTNDLHIFASYREGSKAGGFQSLPQATAASGGLPFAPEHVQAYELGVKISDLPLNGRFNASIFRNEYDDLQFLTGNNIDSFTVVVTDNAASATAQGIELDGVFSPLTALRINYGFMYLDAEFDEYIDGAGADLSGNRLLRAPEFSGNVGVEIEQTFGSIVATLRGDYSHQSRIYFRPDNNPAFSQPDLGLISASLSIADQDKAWSLTFWGKNLSDEAYLQNVILLGAAGIASYAPPRTYGVTLGVSF